MRTFSSPLFVIKTKRSSTDKGNLRIVVSKKIDKRAVVRNKIRRRIKECMREILKKEKQKDYIFIVKENIAEENQKTLCSRVLEGVAGL